MPENVAVLGASTNPDRYSYKAVMMLKEYNHNVYPVHPSARPIDGVVCYPDLTSVPEPLDTITLYLGEKNSTPLINEIIASKPRRIIVNPGAENDELQTRCQAAGIEVIEACTLVLLRTEQF